MGLVLAWFGEAAVPFLHADLQVLSAGGDLLPCAQLSAVPSAGGSKDGGVHDCSGPPLPARRFTFLRNVDPFRDL